MVGSPVPIPNYKEIRMDKYTKKSTFSEYIQPIEFKVMSKMIAQMKTDQYVKKLDTITFTRLFIFAQLNQIASLTDLSLRVKNKKKIQKQIGIKNISKSQLSRKLGDIPPDIFQAVLKHLIQKVHHELGTKKATQSLGNIHLIDSSTITFCLSQYRWADFRNTKAGVKIHQRILFCEGNTVPDKVIITPARPADKTQLDSLIVHEKDALHVFDRGYFDFDKFDEYCEKGIRFCTRLKENTIIHVIEEVPTEPESTIHRDAVVTIGKMKNPLRLVETVDSQGNPIRIVMNDAKVSAQEISDLYRSRWQIELFFKWIKQHLVIKRSYGHGPNAVKNQIYIAMITFCLTLLMRQKLGYKRSLLDLQKHLQWYWSNRFPRFVKALFQEPERSSFGRQKRDDEQLFYQTLYQYEDWDYERIDLYNDLTYDPIYL